MVVMRPFYGDMDVVVLNTTEDAKDFLIGLFEFRDDIPADVKRFAGRINDLTDFEIYWMEKELSDWLDYRIQ